ncbi:MAG: type II toxin-antitoxin system RelE/ParE family toxin [Deltaproteobacteria bacterium]|nr:type II toxin-antitoxin system RelE/ParE family toxin [Deltaproteobacteria bacterium]
MARRLVLRRAAEDDVAEQLTYIADDRPAAAHRYAIALEDAFERIRTMPEVGVLRSFRPRGLKAVRVWPVPGFRRFLVFYRVTPRTVEVIRVLHSSRDIRRALRR